MNRSITTLTLALLSGSALAGHLTGAYIIEGSGFFGAPGIELGRIGYFEFNDPSDVFVSYSAGDTLRYGGADFRRFTDDLIAFENTTNALRLIDLNEGGNTLIDSIGFMDPGVAGMAISNDGTTAYVTTTVGAFVRVVEANPDDASIIAVHNILTDSVSSLAVVPEGHPTLNPGDLYGLALSGTGSLRLVNLDLKANTVASSRIVTGIGFNPQFETGLDFTRDGKLYAVIQGYDEVQPDVFVEISSHVYTIDPATGVATDLGVIQGDGTWDAVTLVINDTDSPCLPDINMDGQINFFDISSFLSFFVNENEQVDFDHNGQFNFFDVSIFLNAYAAGCH